MIFSKLFNRKPRFSDEVQKLYVRIIEQSRQEVFYTDLEVADTVEGRFDMIVLHSFAIMRKLKHHQDQTAEFNQSLFDLMFADFDQNLRELGVGDMGLAKRVPKMAEAFYGRITVYEDGLNADDADQSLKEALDRNLYRKTKVEPESLNLMALYLRACVQSLETQDVSRLLAGQVDFPEPPVSAQGGPNDG